MVQTVEKLYSLTKEIIETKRADLLTQVDETENEIDNFRKNLINRHIERLNTGECKPECSSVFINLVSNLERMGDHLTYIAHTTGDPVAQ